MCYPKYYITCIMYTTINRNGNDSSDNDTDNDNTDNTDND